MSSARSLLACVLLASGAADTLGPEPDVSCLVLVADYGNKQARDDIFRATNQTECHVQVHVIEKHANVTCQDAVPAEWRSRASCKRLPNVGDELHSAAHFVAARYDALPPVVIFAPASFKWSRRGIFRNALRPGAPEFECPSMHRGRLKGQERFALGHYYTKGKGNLTPADPRPLGKWLRVHTDLQGADLDVDVCAHGNFRTTRERLRSRPRELYANITRQLAVPHPEAGHYMERMVGAVFGGKQPWEP